MRIRIIVCFALACSTVGACGGGSDRLSSEEFTTRANAVCVEANREIDSLLDVAVADTTAADTIDEITEIQRQLRAELEALLPPAENQDAHNDWLEGIGAGLAASDDLVDALRAGDPEAQREANEVGAAAATRADAAAIGLGAVECAVDGPASAGTPSEEAGSSLEG